MKIVMVGQGAFGRKHLDGLKNIPDVEVASLVGGSKESTEAVAKQYGIPHATTNLAEALALPGVEAAILTSPTQVHAAQAEQVMKAGKHVEIEIPIADSFADAKTNSRDAESDRQDRDGRAHAPLQPIAPVGGQPHQEGRAEAPATRRANVFLPAQEHQSRRQAAQLDRPSACGTTRATPSTCSTIRPAKCRRLCTRCKGPLHPELKIAMDMSIGMRTPSGVVCNLSLSFNNDGPQGTFFRYICDNGTYIARYDDLFDGKDNKIDLSEVAVSMNGIELQDREFVAAIREKREPFSSVAQVLPAMETLDRLEKSLDA